MKKIYKVLLILCFIILISIVIVFYLNKEKENNLNKEKELKNNIITNIKSHYSNCVSTLEETDLYSYTDNEYVIDGKIGENINIELIDENIDENTKYFKIKGIDLYIEYDKVTPTSSCTIQDRYKNYIVFNKNIKTKTPTSFYNEDGSLVYTINKSFDFQVIVMKDNFYGVEYNNQLLYVDINSIDTIYDSNNTNLTNKNSIRTLTYHFIYEEGVDTCNESICQSLTMVEEHLKYLSENNFFTLKLNELEMYLKGEIQIPQNSIVLTIDDGTIFNLKILDLLEKYKVNATLFVVTSWISLEDKKSDYLDLESHSDNMHTQYECVGYGSQGGGILCLPEETVLNDLKTSREKLGGSLYFAYPFFDFNDRAINLLKQAGFHMAFIGQYDSEGLSYPNKTDLFKVRRLTIFSSDTLNDFISYVNY